MPETFMADPRELLSSLAADGNYFVDDPAKLEQLAQAALDRLNAPPPDALYVVMSNLPGPGAAALVREVLSETVPVREDDYAAQKVIAAAAKASEFVELETADGQGVGPQCGVSWEERPSSDSTWGNATTLHRLGPFAPPATAVAAEVLAKEILRLDARAPVDVRRDEAWPSTRAVSTALMIRDGGS